MKEKIIIISVFMIIELSNLMATPAIWLIGDSTVASYPKKVEPLAGWGQFLNIYCKPGVQVKNFAKSGASTKSFIEEKLWKNVINNLSKNDFLMIQFGHNDLSKKKEKHTSAEGSYKIFLKKFINEARAKGVLPILITPVMGRRYDRKNGKLQNHLIKYANAMKSVAQETNTTIIDLNKIMYEKMLKMSKEDTKKMYNHCPPGKYKHWIKGRIDNGHFNEYGAKIVSGWLVDNAKQQKLEVSKLFK